MLNERIRRARKATSLSLRKVAELVGLSVHTVARYESGALTPASDQLLSLAEVFGVRTEFFFRPETLELKRPEYRKRTTLGKRQLRAIEASILDRVERMHELLSFFPQPPVPAFRVPSSLPEAVEQEADLERFAEDLRQAWSLGLNPIADLTTTLEEQGLMVLTSGVDAGGKFDGLACRVGELPVVVVSADWPGDRQRFTLAHELGHLVLAGRLGDELNEEKACNRFAGAFLAPASSVRRVLGSRRSRLEAPELYALKREFGLSMAAVLYRAKDLGVLSERCFRRMMRELSARGWRREEPGPPIAPEHSRLFEQLTYHALAEDMIGEPKAAELLGQTLSELREQRLMERRCAS